MSGNDDDSKALRKIKAFFGYGFLMVCLGLLLGGPWMIFHAYGYNYVHAKPAINSDLSVEEKTLGLLASSATSLYVIAISVSTLAMAYVFFKSYELFVANNEDL